jgi:hypothetical protein
MRIAIPVAYVFTVPWAEAKTETCAMVVVEIVSKDRFGDSAFFAAE